MFLDATFGYPGQPKLFNKVDFGIDMSSRGKLETYSKKFSIIALVS